MAPYQVTDSTLINYVKATGTFIVWIMADIATSIAGSGLLLACGLGLLLLKRWARMGAVLFGVCSIVFNVLLEVAAYISLLHPLLYSPTNPPGLDTAACIHDVLTFMAAKGVGLIYPVLLVVFMRRPKVVAACQPQRPRK
jgi:hypothetical protein